MDVKTKQIFLEMKPDCKKKVLDFELFALDLHCSANPRPDALMKEQLTEMTGLSQRVKPASKLFVKIIQTGGGSDQNV